MVGRCKQRQWWRGRSSSCVARSELRVPQQADGGEEELRGLERRGVSSEEESVDGGGECGGGGGGDEFGGRCTV